MEFRICLWLKVCLRVQGFGPTGQIIANFVLSAQGDQDYEGILEAFSDYRLELKSLLAFVILEGEGISDLWTHRSGQCVRSRPVVPNDAPCDADSLRISATLNPKP